jgi:LPXTG-motif cell wall-anchored protein
MTFITLAVITALCFAFAATRKYGVVGTGLLLYFQPIVAIGVLLLAGIAYYFYRRKFA